MGKENLFRSKGIISFLLFFGLILCLDNFDFITKSEYLLTRNHGSLILPKFFIYILLYSINIASLFLLFLSKKKFIQALFSILFVIGFTANLSLLMINSNGITLHETLIFLQELSFFDEAVVQFSSEIFFSLIIVFSILLLIFYLRKKFIDKICFPGYLHGLHLIIFASAFIVGYTEGRITEFPSPYKTGYLLNYGIKAKPQFYDERKLPYINPENSGIADHIFFIMDESIRGDFLSLNNYQIDTTPFLKTISDSMINFGTISAIANYSSASNLILMTGLKEDQLPDSDLEALKAPTIFSYMKNNSYNTFLIDNQVFDSYNNFLTKFDIDKLDTYYPLKEHYSNYEDWQLDTAAINLYFNKIIKSKKSFTYLIKSGCHFPFHINTSPDTKIEQFENLGSLSEKEKYLTSIKWSVDKFFERLWFKIRSTDKKILVIYTSDHGQSMKEDGDLITGHSTVIDPPISQVKIPLMIFSNDNSILRTEPDNLNIYPVSAYQLFSTLLEFGGYDKKDIYKYYRKTIFEDSLKNRKFFSGDLFNRGNTFRWNKFD